MQEVISNSARFRFRQLTLLLIDLPFGLLAVLVTLGGACFTIYWLFIELLAWGSFGLQLAYLSFVLSGLLLIAIPGLGRKITITTVFILIGLAIIFIALRTGDLVGSIMGAAFETRDILPMMIGSMGLGIFTGSGIKVGISILDVLQQDEEWILAQYPKQLLLVSALNGLVGIPIGILISGSLGLLLGFIVAVFAALGSGGIKLFYYLLAHIIFKPN